MAVGARRIAVTGATAIPPALSCLSQCLLASVDHSKGGQHDDDDDDRELHGDCSDILSGRMPSEREDTCTG